ncbi:MAG: ABC transporter permease [Cyclobacteriaceae bacterium]|nr:ABC transporter permease [Cyclobacteriaceae bacterium]
MNLPYFISKRINKPESKSFSSTIHKIAVGSISIGLAVMIVSFLILKGFQETVKEKIYAFSAHFQVTKYYYGSSFEEPPMNINTALYKNYKDLGFVDHMQEYAHKAGLMKTEDEVLGIVVKGVGKSFDTVRFSSHLIEGRFINYNSEGYSREVVLSKAIANKLRINTGEDIILHFFQDPPRTRKLNVVGIYETNLSEYYDDRFIIGDIRMIQRLNSWADSIAGGMEIFVKDVNAIDQVKPVLDSLIAHDQYVEKVSEKYIQVFEWLGLIKRQVNIFLAIILVVVCVNMVSIILIMIMERTQMIGTLKALGADDGLIRQVFSYSGARLVTKGMFFGNLIGLGFCAVQYYFEVITLNPHDYYMSVVPVSWHWDIVLWLNLLTFVTVFLILIIPTAAIAGIQPIKAIRFD